MQTQPEPIGNNSQPSWDLVIEDYRSKNKHSFVENIVELMKMRNEIGIKRYGVPLQPYNGRDSVIDAIDEATDLTVYLKNCQREGYEVDGILENHINTMYKIIEDLYCLMAERGRMEVE